MPGVGPAASMGMRPPLVGAPPPGYVNYGAAPASRPQPTVARWATLLGFAGVTAFAAMLGRQAYGRGTIAADVFNGRATLADIQKADDLVQRLAITVIGVQVLAAIMLAVWSHRTARNAATRFPRAGVRTGAAAGGWFIPIANYFLPWSALREACRASGDSAPGSLAVWQFLFVGQAVVNLIARRDPQLSAGMTQTEVVDVLHQQGLWFYGMTLVLAIGTLAAASAMRSIDRLTSGAAVNEAT